MKPTLKLCSSHSATGISKTPDLVTSLEPVPLLFRARGTTRESLIEGAKQKHTQREGLYDLRIRRRGVGQNQPGTEKHWGTEYPYTRNTGISPPCKLYKFIIKRSHGWNWIEIKTKVKLDWFKGDISVDFLELFLGEISRFCGATDTSVLDFSWCLPWVSNPGWIPSLGSIVTWMQWNRVLTATQCKTALNFLNIDKLNNLKE